MTITSEQVGKGKIKEVGETPTTKTLENPLPKSKDPFEDLPERVKNGGQGKVLVKMTRQNYSWTTAKGTTFTKEHPYQLVDAEEAAELKTDGFVEVAPEEVIQYYSN